MNEVIFKDPEQHGRRKKLELVSIIDKAYLESTYQNMARKGWLIDRVKGLRQSYLPIEPCDLDFSVVYFQPDRLMEYPDKEKNTTYQQFIEDAGWTYVDNTNNYHVFYKPVEKDIPDIYTEPEEEYNIIVNSLKKSEFITFPTLILLMIQIVWSGLRFLSYKDFYRPGAGGGIVYGTLILLVTVPYFGINLYWVLRNRRRAKDGKPLVYMSMKITRWKNNIFYGVTALAIVYMVVNAGNMILGSSVVNSSSLALAMGATIIFPILFGIGIAYKVKYIKSKRRTKILIAIVGFFLVWGITVSVVVMAMGSGTGVGDSLGEVDTIPEGVPVLTHGDLGSDIAFEPQIMAQGHTLLAPQSIEYWSRNNAATEPFAYIYVTYVKTIAPWYADMIVDRIVKEEKEKIQEEKEYIDNYLLTTDVSYLDYIDPVDVTDLGIDRGYIISEYHDEIVLLKGRELCIIRLDEEIDHDIILKIIDGIGW